MAKRKMAKQYFEHLTKLIEALGINAETSKVIEVKHFFSGAAPYANGTICASLSPIGLAYKLPEIKATE